uniref:Uncharacterized protein n=1 Tax=virus sp. ctrcb4 TaxID=2825824 RepID=A0A8S5RPX8_9VIRU|nr:MAG TPA: hypothetical protein [virus sp. ctrcb4]DAR12591.1 MAG TPA: hypothetical protein [Crassvirales sp.]
MLETPYSSINYKVIWKYKLESLKIIEIGQSAAKLLSKYNTWRTFND